MNNFAFTHFSAGMSRFFADVVRDVPAPDGPTGVPLVDLLLLLGGLAVVVLLVVRQVRKRRNQS